MAHCARKPSVLADLTPSNTITEVDDPGDMFDVVDDAAQSDCETENADTSSFEDDSFDL